MTTPDEIAEDLAFRTRVAIKPVARAAIAVEAVPAAHRDDLTAIRRIDRGLAARLNALGVHAFATIAGWDRHEVRRVRDALDLGKRIWRENWIEQAAQLHMRTRQADGYASGGENIALELPGRASAVAAMVAEGRGTVVVPETAAALPKKQDTLPEGNIDSQDAEARSGEAAEPEVETCDALAPSILAKTRVGRVAKRLPAPAQRRFAYIRGVSDRMADALRAAGVKSIADIAAWTRADVRWFQAILGEDAQISRDQWIEQAAVLAKGNWTRYALRVVSGETRLLVEAPKVIAALEPALRHAEKDGAADNPDQALYVALAAVPAPGPAAAAATPIDAAAPEGPGPESAPVTATATHSIPSAPLVEQRAEVTRELPHALGRIHPLRGLSTVIALGQLRRPPPDLGLRPRPVEVAADPAPTSGSVVAGGEVARAEQIATAIIEDRFAGGNERAPSARAPGGSAVDAAVADDWADAEALVIQKVEAVAEPRALPPPIRPVAAPALQAADDESTDTWTDDGDDVGDEAEVVIVSRARAQPVPGRAPAVSAAPVPIQKLQDDRSAAEPRFVHRKPRHYEDDHDASDAAYADSAQEATVTIIRAESSEHAASTIFPRQIANDREAPGAGGGAGSLKTAGLKDRFLKALTGD